MLKKMPLLDGYMFAHVMVVILFTFKYCFFFLTKMYQQKIVMSRLFVSSFAFEQILDICLESMQGFQREYRSK